MSYYNYNVKKDINPLIVNNPFFDEWYKIVERILLNPEFQKRKLFMHHHNITVWEHSILVSFKAYMISQYFNADKNICAIAGLLHDFYSQAWISTEELEKLENGKYTTLMKEKKPFYKMHGFTHAKDASLNYVKFFPELENKKITNAIKRHMFPLNPIPPRYKEGIIINLIDKYNSLSELPNVFYITNKATKKIANGVLNFFAKKN